ncbi:hypothetical protein ACORG1_33650 (plasmid) [Mycobacterium sp. TJFP1]
MNPSTVEELRVLVRELIGEVLAQLDPPSHPRSVTITDDDELNDFVRQIVVVLDDPITGPLLRTGQICYHLQTTTVAATSSPALVEASSAPPIEITRGALTERIVADAVNNQATLVLGPGVVITPLARERIRKSSIEIVRRP